MIDSSPGTGGGPIAWRPPEGGLKVGPASAGAEPGRHVLRSRRHATDGDRCRARRRSHSPRLLGGEVPRLDCPKGIEALAAELGITPEHTAEVILEIAAWIQANAVEQMSVKRGLDPRATRFAFGRSGSLLAGRLVELLGLRAALIPASPGTVSAFGLLTVDLRNDYVEPPSSSTHGSTWRGQRRPGTARGEAGRRPRARRRARAGPTSGPSRRPARLRPGVGGHRGAAARCARRGARRPDRGTFPRRAREALRLQLPGRGSGRPDRGKVSSG